MVFGFEILVGGAAAVIVGYLLYKGIPQGYEWMRQQYLNFYYKVRYIPFAHNPKGVINVINYLHQERKLNSHLFSVSANETIIQINNTNYNVPLDEINITQNNCTVGIKVNIDSAGNIINVIFSVVKRKGLWEDTKRIQEFDKIVDSILE